MDEDEKQAVAAAGSKVLTAVGQLKPSWAALYGWLGFRMTNEGGRIMCTKNGCKEKYSTTLVKGVSLVLCITHEAALARVPEMRKIRREQYLSEVRVSALIRAGNAELAVAEAVKAVDYEDRHLDAALAWSKEPDAPADVIEVASQEP